MSCASTIVMVKIKGSLPPTSPKPTDVSSPKRVAPKAPEAIAPHILEEDPSPNSTISQQAGVQEAWEQLRRLRKAMSPQFRGAAHLFADHSYFSPELLDPDNPKNDANYLRLLAAILGIDDLYDFARFADDRDDESFT